MPESPEWSEPFQHFKGRPGIRQIIVVDVTRVQTSCGCGVLLYDYVAERELLTDWAETKGEDGMVDYRREKNMCSIDGLPTPFAMSQAADQPASPAEQVKANEKLTIHVFYNGYV